MAQKYDIQSLGSHDEYHTFNRTYMRREKPYVITIVGAESSGKTRLAMLLASHFKCPWIPEYAREYLQALNRPYDFGDLKIIAQKESERINEVVNGELSSVREGSSDPLTMNSEALSGNSDLSVLDIVKSNLDSSDPLAKKIVIVDGGLMTLRMWSRIKFGVEIHAVEEALKNDVTDLYLLCRPRKEWEDDPFREAPTIVERTWIFNLYLAELIKERKKFEIVRSA